MFAISVREADVTDTDKLQATASSQNHSRLERFLLIALSVVIAYALLAYVVLPALWTHYEHQKALATLPMVTRTAQGIPGDPINVGLVGEQRDVLCAMHAAGCYPADPVPPRSSIQIPATFFPYRPYR